MKCVIRRGLVLGVVLGLVLSGCGEAVTVELAAPVELPTEKPGGGPIPNEPTTLPVEMPTEEPDEKDGKPRGGGPIPSEPTRLPVDPVFEVPMTVLLFTGIIVPARCVQAAIDERGDADYPYDAVRGIIQGADLAVGTLNATMSDFPPHTGCVPTLVLVGSPENADAMARAGFDAMSVATNHIKNCGITTCGDRAFLDTLENLERVRIAPIGAGMNLEDAAQPVVFEINGIRFGIVSLGQIEPNAFAGEGTPGIAVLTKESLAEGIAATREIADVVIFMPHWGPEESASPNWSQLELGRAAVDAGADLVVGNHTHVIQGFHEVDGVPVFYGLGNFVFDQDWARDHQQSLILMVRFVGAELLDYQLIPTIVDRDGTVHLASEAESAEIFAQLEIVNANIPRLDSETNP